MPSSSLMRTVTLVVVLSVPSAASAVAQSPPPASLSPGSPGVTASPALPASPSPSAGARIGPVCPPVSTMGEGLPMPSPTPGPPRERALAATEVFGFLPDWKLGDADTIDLDRLTTLAWFGLEAHPEGCLIRATETGEPTAGWAGWTGETFGDLMARAQQAGVRVVLTVERFAWDADGKRATVRLLKDAEARATLVADIVATITDRGADGVNLDFEPLPGGVRKQFTAMVRELRAAMDAVDPALQLTFDLGADGADYDVRRLTAADAADAAFLMGYEYRTASSRVAGSVAPLVDPKGRDLRGSVRAILRRVPADRVILGLPWYGRAWSTRGPEPRARTRQGAGYLDPSTATYDAAIARATSSGRRYERAAASAWSLYRASACQTCVVSWRQLWYDDVDAFGAKARFALGKGLRGVGIWALGYQGMRPELWSVLRLLVEGSSDAIPPTGSASLGAESIAGEREGVPVVGDTLTLDFVTDDGADGSGVAFVRISTRGRLDDDGQLARGVTFPAADSVEIAMPDADAVAEVFIPGGSARASLPSPSLSPAPSEVAGAGPRPSARPQPTPVSDPRAIRVQWRDVAGNWSRPLILRVLYEAGASPAPEPPMPSPSPTTT